MYQYAPPPAATATAAGPSSMLLNQSQPHQQSVSQPRRGGSLRTFAYVPIEQRHNPMFAKVHPASMLLKNTNDAIIDAQFTSVYATSMDVFEPIVGPVISAIANGSNAAVILAPTGTELSCRSGHELLDAFLPILFDMLPQCPLAFVSMCEISNGGKKVTDIATRMPVVQLHAVSSVEVQRVVAESHWAGVMQSLSTHRQSIPANSDASIFVRIELPAQGCEVLIAELSSHTTALQHATLSLRSQQRLAVDRTIPPQIPFTFALEPYIPSFATVSVVAIPDPATPQDAVASMRVLRFAADLNMSYGAPEEIQPLGVVSPRRQRSLAEEQLAIAQQHVAEEEVEHLAYQQQLQLDVANEENEVDSDSDYEEDYIAAPTGPTQPVHQEAPPAQDEAPSTAPRFNLQSLFTAGGGSTVDDAKHEETPFVLGTTPNPSQATHASNFTQQQVPEHDVAREERHTAGTFRGVDRSPDQGGTQGTARNASPQSMPSVSLSPPEHQQQHHVPLTEQVPLVNQLSPPQVTLSNGIALEEEPKAPTATPPPSSITASLFKPMDEDQQLHGRGGQGGGLNYNSALPSSSPQQSQPAHLHQDPSAARFVPLFQFNGAAAQGVDAEQLAAPENAQPEQFTDEEMQPSDAVQEVSPINNPPALNVVPPQQPSTTTSTSLADIIASAAAPIHSTEDPTSIGDNSPQRTATEPPQHAGSLSSFNWRQELLSDVFGEQQRASARPTPQQQRKQEPTLESSNVSNSGVGSTAFKLPVARATTPQRQSKESTTQASPPFEPTTAVTTPGAGGSRDRAALLRKLMDAEYEMQASRTTVEQQQLEVDKWRAAYQEMSGKYYATQAQLEELHEEAVVLRRNNGEMDALIKSLVSRVSKNSSEQAGAAELKTEIDQLMEKNTKLQQQLEASQKTVKQLESKERARVRGNTLNRIGAQPSVTEKKVPIRNMTPAAQKNYMASQDKKLQVAQEQIQQLQSTVDELEGENAELIEQLRNAVNNQAKSSKKDGRNQLSSLLSAPSTPPGRGKKPADSPGRGKSTPVSKMEKELEFKLGVAEQELELLRGQLEYYKQEVSKIQLEKEGLQRIVATHPRSTGPSEATVSVGNAVLKGVEMLEQKLSAEDEANGASDTSTATGAAKERAWVHSPTADALGRLKKAVDDIITRQSIGAAPSVATSSDTEVLMQLLSYEVERVTHLRAFIPSFAQLAAAAENELKTEAAENSSISSSVKKLSTAGTRAGTPQATPRTPKSPAQRLRAK